ncbi:hypothetical protein Dda_4327 [Drechslerella dactyloides]|uniref:Uncharacterized protein n=1 Tax=Drechslerella dactyloides TaxID=74499 RepID=A0AAD6IX41_DREDA|nr:hypothetical protein Dda_4327 [Drechslerella dactyloides]
MQKGVYGLGDTHPNTGRGFASRRSPIETSTSTDIGFWRVARWRESESEGRFRTTAELGCRWLMRIPRAAGARWSGGQKVGWMEEARDRTGVQSKCQRASDDAM